MDQSQLEHLLNGGVLVPGPDGPRDADAKASMQRAYPAYHERIIAYGRTRRDALIEARRSRCPRDDDPG